MTQGLILQILNFGIDLTFVIRNLTTMQSFLKKHSDGAITALAGVFIVMLAWSFIWGIMNLASEINRVFNFSPAAVQSSGFDIKGAAGLDLKGLVQNQATSQ